MVKSGEIEEAVNNEYQIKIKQATFPGKYDKNQLKAELEKIDAEYFGETKEGFLRKQILKRGGYYEVKPFFDGLSGELPVPENPVETKNYRQMTEKEMTEGYEFFSKEEAFGLACKHKKEGKNGLIWFLENDKPYYVYVSGSGELVKVDEFDAGNSWHKGPVSFFRNKK
jgi:hypothetical protein